MRELDCITSSDIRRSGKEQYLISLQRIILKSLDGRCYHSYLQLDQRFPCTLKVIISVFQYLGHSVNLLFSLPAFGCDLLVRRLYLIGMHSFD
jgi:hypothetical protein